MKSKRKSLVKWSGIAVRCLLGLIVVQSCFGGGAVIRSEARTSVTEKEVAEFVTAYYEANSPQRIDTLADYVADPESLDFQASLITLQVAFEHGFTGLENISVIVYPMSDGEHWVVPVSSEWVIQGFDVRLPGLKAELVGRNPKGELQIESSNDDAEWDEALIKEMRELCLSDEVIDLNTEIATKYNGIIADNPDMAEWLLRLNEEVDKAKAEAADRITYDREDADKENSAGKGKRYTVKKGDCLWDIAETQLGDGMRWSGIYKANKALIGDDPDLLYVGIELELEN